MKKLLISAICIAFCFTTELKAQKQDTTFYDRNWNITSKKLAGYYRIESKIKTEDTTYWEFHDHYMDNDQVQNEGFLTKKAPEVRHGLWTWYYQNGNKEMEGLFNKNEREGLWSFYYQDGALKKQGLYTKKGKQNGYWTWFHPDSTLMSKVLYKEDTIIGKRVVFHDNGIKKSEEFYKKGKLDSLQTDWFSNGKIKSQALYLKGFKNGTEKVWYMNGGLKSEISYKSGISEKEFWYSMEGDTVPKDSVVDEKEFHNLLWKISGNGLEKPSYLFGTMHVKDKIAFEFSDSMLLAFNEVEGYSMEIHPDSLYAYYFKQYDKNKSWTNFGSEILGVEEGDKYFNELGGDNYGSYDDWIMNLNEVFHRDEYNPEGMPYFVDCYLYYIATKQGKFTDGIERVSDHVNAGKNLSQSRMKYDILSKFDPEEEMLSTYQEGNLKKINALMEFLQDEEFRYRLLTLRNVKMANSIDSLAHLRPTFNTAGTAHLPGDDGLIELLKQKGYTITPIKAIFSGDTLDATVNNFKSDWKTVRPFKADFTVSSPGPLTAFNNGITRNIFLDPIREIGVDAFQLDERWFGTGSKGSKVEKSDINYLFDYPQITDKKKIKTDGVRGLELRWKVVEESYYGGMQSKTNTEEEKEEAVYYRTRVYKKDFKMHVVKVASSTEDSLNSAYSETFLNSVKWDDKKEEETVEWQKFTDTLGAFSIVAPSNQEYNFLHYNPKEEEEDNDYYRNNLSEYKIHLWKSEDKGNQFIWRYNNSANGKWYFEDKEVMNWGLDYYTDFIPNLKDSSYSTLNDYPCLEASIKANKKYNVHLKYINRGYRFYLLIAKVKDNKHGDKIAKAYFDSFEFIDFKDSKLVKYIPKKDSISLYLPKETEDESLTNKRTYIPERKTYSKPYLKGNDDSDYWDDEYYPLVAPAAYSYSEKENTKSDSDEKVIKPYLSRNKYMSIDTAQGITYQTYMETFSEYFKLENRDTLFSYWKEDFIGTYYIIDTTYRDSTIAEGKYWMHMNFKHQNQNGLGQIRFTQKGNTVVVQRVFYPHEIENHPNIKLYFDSLDLKKISAKNDLFADKSQKIFTGLLSKDSLEQAYSRKALLFYPFDSTHVAQIQAYAIKEAALDTTDHENNALDLINLLTYINDSTTADFMVNFSKKYFRDSIVDRTILLGLFHEIDDSLAFYATLDFVKDSVKEYKKYSSIYSNVLEQFEDSLQLYASNNKLFNHWYSDTLWYFNTKMIGLATKCFDNAKINTKGIKDNEKFFVQKYLYAANYYKKLNKDTSIYNVVRRNMIQFTDLISRLNIANDSIEKIMSSLLEDKNKELRFMATKGLFRIENALSSEKKDKMFRDIKNRYKLMLVLNEIKATDRIPEKYSNHEAISEAQLYHALTNSNDEDEYYYESENPVKMKILKEVKDKVMGEKVIFYVYSYYDESYRREKKIAVSDPLSIKKDSLSFYNYPNVESREYADNKKAIKRLIKSWKENYEFANEDDFEFTDTAIAVEAYDEAEYIEYLEDEIEIIEEEAEESEGDE